MTDVEIIGVLKTYIAKTLVGMGALKGANCRIKSIVKADNLNTVTFIWTDTDGTSKESTMLVYDGAKGDTGATGATGATGPAGADGYSPTITVKTSTADTYILTITDANGSYDTPNLKGGGGSGSSTLAELTDVDLNDLAAGNVLIYDAENSKWVNTALKVSNLADVAFTELADENMIYYDATAQKWKNVEAGAVSDASYNAISALLQS